MKKQSIKFDGANVICNLKMKKQSINFDGANVI